MASGSDVACHVSQLVLLDSDFSAMPSVVMEGRRVINNIERSASLFLVKNIFSFFLSLISLIAVLPYPINASQLSLVSAIVIGIPSFVLALEPNKARVEGNFIRNVLFKALPSGFTNLILVLAMMVAAKLFGFSYEVLSTSTAMIMTMVGFVMLFNICRPFNKIRVALIVFLLAAMAFALVFLSGLFSMHPITGGALFVLIILMLMAYPLNLTITRIMTGINNYMHRSRKTSKH